MSRLIFDIETNGLIPEMTVIHCISIKNIQDTDRTKHTHKSYRPHEIADALALLESADEIIGHNIIGYDIPAIQKLYPKWKPKGKVTDTLVLSRLIKADLISEDASSVVVRDGFLKRMYGSHSLKAWGLRLGKHKGDYDGGWATFSEDMLLYMEQDVIVTEALLDHLMKESRDFSEPCFTLEHELAEICERIGTNGWTFDMEKAASLYATLSQKRLTLDLDLQTLFDPWEIRTPFTPKVNNASRGYVKGELTHKVKVVHFNPNSRKHIARCLIDKYKWKPKLYTPSGDPQIDETVLGALSYPEAQHLTEYLLVQKRIAALAEGKSSWMQMVDSDGKIRHQIISGGTVSGRAAHRSPNLGNVPSTRAIYGKQCRELFTVPKGWFLCGSDLSGIELRCLATLLDDNGEYAKLIMESDIHTHNMVAAGISDEDGSGRTKSKEFIYSSIFGGGDALIGKIVGGNAVDGKRLKAEFDKNVPAFKSLKQELTQAYKMRGYIKGIDNRKLYVRSEHRCLSQILQSSGAIIAKQWLQIVDREIIKQGLKSKIVGWIHDELQIACPTEKEAHHVGDITRRASKEAGEVFKFKIPIDAEYTVGKTWADTH